MSEASRPAEGSSMGRTWTLDDPSLQGVLKRMVEALCPAWFSADLREDVLQEIWFRLARHGDHPDGARREFNSTFLWVTTRNVRNERARNAVRRIQREVPLASDEQEGPASSEPADPYPAAPSPDPNPGQAALGRAIGRAIRQCLSRLRPERRRAVTLYLLGFKVPEIAHRLGWTMKSAEGRVYKGLQQLRDSLVDAGVTP